MTKKRLNLIMLSIIGISVISCGIGSSVQISHYAFVANAGNNGVGGSVSVCSITESGGIIDCVESNIGVTNNFSPSSIAINGNYAYINDTNSSLLYTCKIIESTLSNCNTSTPNGYIPTSFGGISTNNNYLYASYGTNTPESAVVCGISNSGVVTNCDVISSIPSGLSGTFSFNDSFGYIADYDHNGMQQCSIGANGMLNGCDNTITNDEIDNPVSVLVNNNISYIVNSGTQNISSFVIDNNGGFTFLGKSSVNSIGSNGSMNNMALFNGSLYIPNNEAVGNVPNNSIAKCVINNNVPVSCTYYTDQSFNTPQSITIR